MKIIESEYVDVVERAKSLGCEVPTGVTILPNNFETAPSRDELVFADTAIEIRKLWRSKKINQGSIEKDGETYASLDLKSLDWIGPTILFTAAFISQDPTSVSIAINVFSNYLTDWLKGRPGNGKVRLEIVVEQTKAKKYKRFTYEGPIEGLESLPKIIHEASDE